jgi:N-acetylmuramoyl-L-alanine amidase
MGAGVDLFLSIHSNAWNKITRGTEVFYSVDIPADKPFAEKLVAAVSETLGIPNRGAKLRESVKYPGEDYYTVIDTAQDCGAKHVMLIETAFHDNTQDEQLLKSDANLRKIMQATARVICGWFGVAKSTVSPSTQYQQDVLYLADKVGIGVDYWLKKQNIDTYFAELIHKLAEYIRKAG